MQGVTMNVPIETIAKRASGPTMIETSNKGTKCYTKPVCTFSKRNGACRVNPDGSDYGDEGTDYNNYEAGTLDDCREECDGKNNCKGYEWSEHRCEI